MGMKSRQNDFCVRMEKLLSRKQTLKHSTSVRWRLVTLLFLTAMVWLGAAVTPSGVSASGENSEQTGESTIAAETAEPHDDPSNRSDASAVPFDTTVVATDDLVTADQTITLSHIPQTIGFKGITEFESRTLSAIISGVVSRVLKSPGDSVESLEVVAEVDSSDLQRDLARARFDLELANAQEAVAHSELDGAQSERATAEGSLKHAENLGGRISETELLKSHAVVTQKSAAVRTAKAQLQAAQVKVKLAKLNVDAAQLLVKSSQIVSNVDGRIDEVLVRPGEYVIAGTPIVKISESRTVYVTTTVPFPQFHPAELHGQPAVVEIPISPNRRSKVVGKIESTATNVRADGHFRIAVALNNVSHARLPQLMGGVEVTVYLAENNRPVQNQTPAPSDQPAEFVKSKEERDQPGNSDREIAVLNHKIAQLSALAKRIDALHHKGAAGGEAQHHAAVFYQLRHAEAQLAGLQGDTIAQLEFLADAVTQAKRRHEALAVALEAGTTTLDQLLDATEELAAIQLEQQHVTAQLKSDRSPNPTVPTPATE
jgi:multidrug resistance efflux pump